MDDLGDLMEKGLNDERNNWNPITPPKEN